MVTSPPNCEENKCVSGSACCTKDTSIDVYAERPEIDYSSFKVQSSSDTVQSSSSVGSDQVVATNVKFNDDVPGESIDLPEAIKAVNLPVGANVELHKFLSRPVNIYSYSWPVGGGTDFVINPWYLFLNHTSIKKKVDNYYLFRGNLNIKILVNAAPFYYGCCMASYYPLTQYSNPIINLSTGVPNVNMSQLPRAYLYPSPSQGATMKLPFFWHKDWCNLTSATDVQALGALYFRFLDSLKNSNGSTTGITIQVYAWLSDVELNGPTVKLALQSGTSDEYGEGSISKPASAVSRALGELSEVPVIGPYATAGSMIAGAAGRIASLFGFTNIPVIEDVHSFTPDPHPKFASVDIGTAIDKLTLDAKNELTIDPKCLGVDLEDELNISSFVQRESYLTTFSWTTAGVADTLLWNSRVTPSFARYTADVSQTVINATPVWMMQRCFNYWKGDLEFRFKIICSQYHRGRLRFSWDPVGALATTTDSTTEVYTKIVDIADTTDVIIRIPYLSQFGWLQTNRDTTTEVFNTTALTSSDGTDNGLLTVRILNELTAPITTADINILVFVRGADNLEFATPISPDNTSTISPYTVQTSLLSYDDDSTLEESIALKPSVAPPETNLIYMGECIRSIRTLLRRTFFARSSFLTKSTSTTNQLSFHASYFSRFPPYPGFDPNGFNNATAPIAGTSKPYNFTTYNYITWFTQCFKGYRGSINWKVNCNNPNLICEQRLSRPNARVNLTRALYNSVTSGAATQIAAQRDSATNGTFFNCGTEITNYRTLSSNAASFPMYSQYKLMAGTPDFTAIGSAVDGSDNDGCLYQQLIHNQSSVTTNSQFFSGNMANFYVSAGTDFSLYFYMAAPTLYQYTVVPQAQTDP